MCGICGFTGPENPEWLRRMNASIVHRGPDDDGYLESPGVNLGMRRLSIVDETTGRQPMFNEDGAISVVFNGEIYNHVEIRKYLINRGHRFKSDHSDTETTVHLYEEYGEHWPHLGAVNGMFGIALWDSRYRRLLLYRDRIGKKPLYWARAGNDIVFASEIKAILQHPMVSPDLDLSALYHYFSLKNISAPSTAFKGINQLLPGQYLVWEDGNVRLDHYWSLDFSNPLNDITAEDAAEELLRLLEDAVRLRMQCDAPFGAYLSGGIDSSSVVALMCRNQSQPITTFCLGYDEEAKGPFLGKSQDIEFARIVSDRLGTEHHEYFLGPDEFADGLPDVLSAFDEPFSGTISTFFLSPLIQKHVKTALSGDGADELFGSYLSHRLAGPIDRFLKLPQSVRQSLESLSPHQRSALIPFDMPGQFDFLRSLAHPDQANWRMRLAVFDDQQKQGLLSPDFLAAATTHTHEVYAQLVAKASARDPLNAVLEVEQQELLPNQVLPFMDRLSMAHSVEVRSPFLDYRIIEFANSLPGNLKIRNGVNKYVHKLMVDKILPEGISERPKEGFVQPIYAWMRDSLKPWVGDVLTQKRLASHGLIRWEPVNRLLNEHSKNRFDHSAKIWNLVCFQVWYETMVESKGTVR